MGPRTSRRRNVDGSDAAPLLLDEQRDVLVIRPLGRLDIGTIERVGQLVAESSTAVIVDLDECVLADPRALAAIDDRVLGGVEVCIVSGRLSCRQLLARSGTTARFPVFQRRADARQALLLAAEGYGRGWSMP